MLTAPSLPSMAALILTAPAPVYPNRTGCRPCLHSTATRRARHFQDIDCTTHSVVGVDHAWFDDWPRDHAHGRAERCSASDLPDSDSRAASSNLIDAGTTVFGRMEI